MLRVLFILLRIAVPIAIVYFAWRILRPKWAFTITADETGVCSHEGIKTPQQRRLLELFQKTRFVEGKVKICGRHDENGTLQLQFFGNISDDTKQQVRNYVVNEL